jgi:hypothetical protein
MKLIDAACQLAIHGRAKHPEKQGLDEVSERVGELVEKNEYYNADPLGIRDGNACEPKLAMVCRLHSPLSSVFLLEVFVTLIPLLHSTLKKGNQRLLQ